MATASTLLTEDQLRCCFCLDVFTDPVSTSCGHNFCKSCITEYWNANTDRVQCPMCKEIFNRRPELRINTFIAEMAAQFRESLQNKTSSSKQLDKEGDIPCDVCTETKAVKSCLVCLTSYCETHLEPHHRIAGLKRHQLINPVKNLEDRVCKKHERPLEMFCTTDRINVCQFCTASNHKGHHIIPLKEEYDRKKAELGRTEARVQQMIQERQSKIKKFKQSVKLSQEDGEKESAASVQVFRDLSQFVTRELAQLIGTILEAQKIREKQVEGFINELEEEICELMKRSSELKQLSHAEDHLHFLQSFSPLNAAPPTKDWTTVRVHTSYRSTVRTAVRQLEELIAKRVEKLSSNVELEKVQRYSVDVTLDPESANFKLILSDDRKQVSFGAMDQNLPDSPKRFSPSCGVLGTQSFSSGRFYYEVQVKEKTSWDLGVALGCINRKGRYALSPKNGYWTIILTNDGIQYIAQAGPNIRLSLKSQPQKVGVFVDYEEGVVSFYDVHSPALIFSYTSCKFTDKLHPYFSPRPDDGTNPAPLTICPVQHKH